jgi:hypothetical protein
MRETTPAVGSSSTAGQAGLPALRQSAAPRCGHPAPATGWPARSCMPTVVRPRRSPLDPVPAGVRRSPAEPTGADHLTLLCLGTGVLGYVLIGTSPEPDSGVPNSRTAPR